MNILAIVYFPMILAAKLAILLQIKHVFVVNRPSTRYYICQFLIWIHVLYSVTFIFLDIFLCLSGLKTRSSRLASRCPAGFHTNNRVNAYINVVSDVVILVIPILWVWKLQMAWKRKLGSSLIFTSGILYAPTSLHYADRALMKC